MNVYYIKNHKIAGSAIIVAPDRLTAFNLLASKLWKQDERVALDYREVNPNEFKQLDCNSVHAVML